jgi:hypothetical protein
MNKQGKPSVSEDENAKYAQVPSDFPRPMHHGAIAGAQPKLLLTEYDGRYYAPGGTPPEVWQRWDICEDLAQQFYHKCLATKAGKRSGMSESAILEQYCTRLLKTGWGSDEELRWVIRRAAAVLSWPVPELATEPAR